MPTQKPVNILLVDDNAAKRQALAAALEDLGQNLVVAGSSREALQLALQRDYAVLLLDVQMPDMNGFELAALIAAARGRNIYRSYSSRPTVRRSWMRCGGIPWAPWITFIRR